MAIVLLLLEKTESELEEACDGPFTEMRLQDKKHWN